MTSVSPDSILKGGIAVVDELYLVRRRSMGDRVAENYRNDRHRPPLPCALGAVRLAYAGKGREVESARKGQRWRYDGRLFGCLSGGGGVIIALLSTEIVASQCCFRYSIKGYIS